MTLAKLHVLLDGDGVLWRAGDILDGAREFVKFLRERGIGYSLMSNNSSKRRATVADAMRKRGLDFAADDIFNSNYLAGCHLAEHNADDDILVIGHEQLRAELHARGLNAYSAADLVPLRELADPGLTVAPFLADKMKLLPSVVLVGIDTAITWGKIALACRLVEDGARLIATNRDYSFPVERGYLLPGNGAVVALIENVTGAGATNLGKPETALVELVEREKAVARENMVMLGDRLETDMEMAVRAGIRSVLVLTGTTKEIPERWPERQEPTFVMRDLSQFRERFDECFSDTAS